MISPAHNITLLTGSNVLLNCSAIYDGDEFYNCSKCLVWKHNNKTRISQVIFTSMYGKLSSILPLNDTTTATQGNYSCQKNGTMSASSIFISIIGERAFVATDIVVSLLFTLIAFQFCIF